MDTTKKRNNYSVFVRSEWAHADEKAGRMCGTVFVYRAYKSDNPRTVASLGQKNWGRASFDGTRSEAKTAARKRNDHQLLRLQEEISYLQARVGLLQKANR